MLRIYLDSKSQIVIYNKSTKDKITIYNCSNALNHGADKSRDTNGYHLGIDAPKHIAISRCENKLNNFYKDNETLQTKNGVKK